MMPLKHKLHSPGLLVSVRNAEEAAVALAAGADVIDVKEPNRGSLGAADTATIAAVVETVAGRAPVSAALGELRELDSCQVPAGVAFVKIGLAGCGHSSGWASQWQKVVDVTCRQVGSSPRPVAVVYADWRNAVAPNPDDVLEAAAAIGCTGLLIDTWNKTRGDLFHHFPSGPLRAYLHRVVSELDFVVLAGSLAGDSLLQAAAMMPHLVAVRGAACNLGRKGQILGSHVRDLKVAIGSVSRGFNLPFSFSALELLNGRASDKFS
jgi:uncharacterized protein (UPF0264 family)